MRGALFVLPLILGLIVVSFKNHTRVEGRRKGCTLASVNNQTIYTWTENGQVVYLLPKTGEKIMEKEDTLFYRQ